MKIGIYDAGGRNPFSFIKRGRWIANDILDSGKSSVFHCSKCGLIYASCAPATPNKVAEYKRYCENCGAKMLGEKRKNIKKERDK